MSLNKKAAKADNLIKKSRSIGMSDVTWDCVTAAAEAAGESVSAYVERRLLEPEVAIDTHRRVIVSPLASQPARPFTGPFTKEMQAGRKPTPGKKVSA